MKRLRVPPLGEQQSPWTTFKVGLFLGAFVVLVAAVILTGECRLISSAPCRASHYYCNVLRMLLFIGYQRQGSYLTALFSLQPNAPHLGPGRERFVIHSIWKC